MKKSKTYRLEVSSLSIIGLIHEWRRCVAQIVRKKTGTKAIVVNDWPIPNLTFEFKTKSELDAAIERLNETQCKIPIGKTIFTWTESKTAKRKKK